jgi:hypothetical protein
MIRPALCSRCGKAPRYTYMTWCRECYQASIAKPPSVPPAPRPPKRPPNEEHLARLRASHGWFEDRECARAANLFR